MLLSSVRLFAQRTSVSARLKILLTLAVLFWPVTYLSQTPEILSLGVLIERQIGDGERHVFAVEMPTGSFAALSFAQEKIDMTVTISDPDGKEVRMVGALKDKNHLDGPTLIAEKTGRYLLTVTTRGKNSKPGKYFLKLLSLGPPTDKDRALLEAAALTAEGKKLNDAGKYDESLAEHQKALEILQRNLSPDDPRVADALTEVAGSLSDKGENARAKETFLKALSAYERSLGPESYYVAVVLNNLGSVQRTTGDFDGGVESYKRALAIDEKLFGVDDQSVATINLSLGLLYYAKGEYAKVEPLFVKAHDVRIKNFGENSIELMPVYNQLALLYRLRGDHSKAVNYLEKALAIAEKRLNPDHPNLATIMSNTATVSAELGDISKATDYFTRSLAISEKNLGPDHPDLANTLNNFGGMYNEFQEEDKAEPLFLRAIAIREKLGPDNLALSAPLSNLGLLYVNTGEYAKAEPLLLRALEINRQKLGENNASSGVMTNNLGLLYLRQKKYAEAEPLFLRALEIIEKNNSPWHPYCGRMLANLANLYTSKGDVARAIEFQNRYLAIRDHNIDLNLYTGSERQKLAYMATLTRDIDFAVSTQARLDPDSTELKETAARLIISRKGRTLDAMAETFAALRRRSRPEDQELIDRLSDVRTQLANQTLRGAGGEKPEVYRARLKSIEDQREKLENDLSRRSSEFRARKQPITLDAVRAAVPDDAALIEFIAYRTADPTTSQREIAVRPARYAAYIIRKSGSIGWKDLGDAKAIDNSIDALRAALGDPKRTDVMALSRTVDSKVLEPLRPLLGGASHLLISPDGDLNLLPFEALVDEKNGYLVENRTVSYVTSGRDLLRSVATENSGQPLVVADPAFGDSDQGTDGKVVSPVRTVRAGDVKRSSLFARRLEDTYFAPLSNTALEARSILSIYPNAKYLSGTNATESSLKATAGPSILHIATHGFFLQDDDAVKGTVVKRQSGNPLLRSGLALAGANRRDARNDDGILTALEASGLNLWGTKLVVVSACDTGVGEIRNGEGVYGLRRSFVLAGAESMLMSLWPVSDLTTRELMTGYYKNLKQGLGRGESLRRVQLDMLKRPNRRHPFYWASFIQSGDWKNL